MLAKKFKVPSSIISVDCDAISIFISTDEMTTSRKASVKSFFSLFGTPMTFRCQLPHTVVGSTKEDSVFGCTDNNCMHLPPFMQGNEMLVMDTPVKVALHKSCKGKVISSLREKNTYLFSSNSQSLCFNRNFATNKPSYQNLVDSIIDSCYVETTGSYAIHLADFGMKLPISPGENNCALSNLFKKIHDMREAGLNVEVLQIDVAFSIPSSLNKLIQLIYNTNSRAKRQRHSVLANSVIDRYVIHKLPSIQQNEILKNAHLEGTFSLKKNREMEEKEPPQEYSHNRFCIRGGGRQQHMG